ncbi:ligand-gated channel protein [Achromobacter piechaudii]|uniref:Colicin I receptor n=1 Tax=Achromobacter piechaudii TaxID=72556 RepID=A0A6S7DDM5_9BURK|nr:ligand-gated channel protein [Achromobacter piechaudii]CAB3879995.1 Colicin I receptor [Achromobacter piechaudii]
MSSNDLALGGRVLTSRTQLAAALCAAGLGMGPAAAWAQGANEAKTLDTVVVTASGFEQQIQDAPASISVITREDLDKKFYRDVNDALIDVPGVIVTGGGDRQDISLRGMGPQYTLILIDGRRQSSRETRTNSDSAGVEGGWTPPLAAIERIEVVRGPMSSLYGSDAMGGVINIITRKVPKEWGGEIRMDTTIQESSKSGDIYQGNFYLAGPIKNDLLGLQIYGQASQRDEDNIVNGFRKRNSDSVTAKLALTPNRDHDIVLEATAMRQKIQETLGKTVAPLAPGVACARTGCPASAQNDYRSNKWALSHTGRWGWAVSDSYVQQEEFDNRSRQMKVKNLNLQSSWTLPLGSHMLTLGGTYLSQRLNDQTGNQLSGGPNKIDRYQWALFAEDEWRLTDSFAVTAGLRMDEDENFGTHFSPRLYGVWRMADRWTLKGGVSTGFRAPDLRQTVAGWGQVSRGGNMYGNPDLTPEKSVTEEIGLLYDDGAGFNAGVTLFNNDFKDKITRVACPLTQCTEGPNQFGSNPTTYMNVDKAVSRGVEASMKLPLTRDWSLTSSYTFTKSEQKSGQYKGEPLNQLPKHLFTTTVDWQASDALQAWARVNYRGKESQPTTGASSSSVVAPSYTFVDLGASYAVNKTVSVYAGIYNLFDKQVTYDDYEYVEDGRRYWLGVGVKF